MKAVLGPGRNTRIRLFAPLLFAALVTPTCSSGGGGNSSGSGGLGSGGTGSGGHVSGGSNAGSGGSNAGSGGSNAGSGGASSGSTVGTGGHVASSSGGNSATGGAATGGSSYGSGSGGVTGSGGVATGGTSTGGVTATGGAGSGTGGIGGRTGAGGGTSSGTGASGAPGPGGASGPPIFTADFESDTVGKQAAGWDNFISYNFNTTNPQGDGTGALVDTSKAHGGKNSVHFKSSGNPVMIERALPAGTNRLYVRAYFYMTTQLGNGPQGENHETLLGLHQDPKSANNQVRFGEIKGAIGTNEVPSDNIAPKMASWYMPPVITANAWHCIEVAFLGDQAQHALYAWSDGVLVHSITASDQWQNGSLPMNWLNGKFVDVMFGWQSFSSQANEVWMDDLVLSNGPIGCN